MRACVALAAAASLITTPAWAGPQGGQVVGGQAIIQTLNQETLIKQSTQKSIINWNSYKVLKGQSVIYQEPNSKSISLNRVLGGQAATVLGTIQSNGQVWLVDPNGVLFGKGSTVNAAGLLATTADIANSDFLAGKYQFGIASPNAGAGIANYGTINTQGGSTVLAAPNVDNEGTISAKLGTVAVGAGKTFAVDFDGDNLLSFAVSAPAANAQIKNAGTIAADGGTVQLTARSVGNIVDNVINTTGIVQANSVSIKNGTVILDGGASGTVSVGGTVSAQGLTPGSTGGTVQVTGATIDLTIGANINASGQAGGGLVLIGGNFHGAGPLPNAQTVTIAQGATIAADATDNGNGGQVAVWSQQHTAFNGTITARGGPNGGNGGDVETSSAADLTIGTGTVDTRAPHGAVGTWLLDPLNVIVANTGGTVTPATIDAATSNVVLQATNNITFTDPVDIAAPGVAIAALAGNSIVVNGSITTNGGNIKLSANDPGETPSGNGAITLNAALNTTGDGGTALGGNVLLTGTAIAIGADVTTGGSQYYVAKGAENALGTITLNGNLTAGKGVTPPCDQEACTPGSDIQFVGNVDVAATSPISVVTNGTISGGEILITGALTGNTGNLTLDATANGTTSGGLIAIGGTVLQNNGDNLTPVSGADANFPSNVTYKEGPTQLLSIDEGGDVDITETLDQTRHILIDPASTLVDIVAVGGGGISVIPTIDMASPPVVNGPIPLTATGTAVTLYGTIGTASPFASVTVTATDGTATVTGGIGSPVLPGSIGAVELSGASIAVGGNITTAGGQVTFDDAAVLAGDTRIDTTGGGAYAGATITFSDTLDDSVAFSHTLTLAAGTAGDINFNGRVGANNSAGGTTGITPAGITITSAENVNLNIPLNAPNFDGFHVGQFVVEGTGNANCTTDCVNGAASINAPGSYISTFNPTGNAGAVNINITGNVEIGRDLFAGGGLNGTTGKSGGNITINAGGRVSIGDQLGSVVCDASPCSTNGALPLIQYISVFAGGYSSGFNSGPGQSAGNGGIVSITAGGDITLPNGVVANGGAAILNSAIGNGGKAGSVTLASTGGNVSVGAPTSNGNSGNMIGVDAFGGSAANGNAGDGADVSISGKQLTVTHVYTEGGDTTQSTGAGKGGNITLTATATIGPAITLLGESDARDTSTPSQATLDSRGGKTLAVAGTNLIKLDSNASTVITGAAGNITLQGDSSGDPLQGAAYVRLADNSLSPDFFNGGSTVFILAAGGTGNAGAINLLGPIEGDAGTEGLRVQGGAITVGGNIGDLTPLTYVSFKSTSPMLIGDSIHTHQISVLNCTSTPCNGSVTFSAPVQLTDDLEIHTNGGDITFNGPVNEAVANSGFGLNLFTSPDSAQLSPTSGTVTFGAAVGQTNALGSVLVVANAISLQAVTTTGAQTYIDGLTPSIALNGNLTATGAGADIVLSGAINVAQPNLTITTNGTVSSGNIVLDGSLGGAAITLNAGQGLVWENGALACGAPNTCGQTQTLSGTIDTSTLDQTKHILLSDDTTFVNDSGNLRIMPSIDAAPGDSAALTVTQQANSTGGIKLFGTIGGGNAVDDVTITALAGQNVGLHGIGSIALGGVTSAGGVTVSADVLKLYGFLATQSAPVTINASLDQRSNGGPIATIVGGAGADVTLNGGVSPDSEHGLVVLAGAGDIVINGPLGTYSAPIGHVQLQGNDITLKGGTIVTDNARVMIEADGGKITLGSDLTIDTTGGQYSAGAPIMLTGNIDSDSSSSPRALSIFSGAGPVTFNGSLGSLEPLGQVNVLTAGTVTFNDPTGSTSLVTAGKNVTFGGAQIGGGGEGDPTILGNIVAQNDLTIDTTGNFQTLGAAINLGLPVDVAIPGGSSLTLAAGTAGRIDIAAPIGANVPVDNFLVSANQVLLGAGINSAGGTIAFNAPVVLSSSFTGSQIVVATNADGATDGTIVFNSTIDSQNSGQVGLFLQTGGGGSVALNGKIGGTTPIGDLTVTASLINLYSDITTQSNKVEFDGPVVLQNSIAINTAGGQGFNVPGGDVTFNGTVDALSSGVQALTVNAGGQGCAGESCGGGAGAPGTVTFAGDVGSGEALNTLLVRGGDISLQNVTTTGSQYYVANGVGVNQGTVTLNGNLTAGSGVIPATHTAGSDIQFIGNVNVAGSDPVTVTTNGTIAGGEILVNGNLTGNLGNLTLNAGNGLIAIGGTVLQNQSGGGVTGCPAATCVEGMTNEYISTDPTFTLDVLALFSSEHILIDDPNATAIVINNDTPGHDLTVFSTIDMIGRGASPPTLSITQTQNSTTGVTVFGTIGDAAPFGGVQVTALSGNPVEVHSIGSPVFYGAGAGGVTLTAGAGAGVTMGGTISTESGAVDVYGPVTLAGNLAIDTTVFDSGNGGYVNFHNTVDGGASGGQALTINAGGDLIAFNGNVGSSTPLGAVTLTSNEEIDLYGNLFTKGGAVTINGGLVLQNSGLTIDTTYGSSAGANVTFNGTVDSPGCECDEQSYSALTVNAGAGNIAIRGDWGGGVPLGTVTLTADTVALGANITTAGTAISGSVNINGNILLVAGGNNVGPIGGDPVIDTTAGGSTAGADIVIAGNGGPGKSIGHIDDLITGSDALMLSAGAGTVDLEAEIGQTAPIGNLMLAGQTIQLGGGATDGLTINTFGAGGNGAVTMQGAVVLEGAVTIDTTTVGSSGANIQFGASNQLASIDNADGQAGFYGISMNAGTGTIDMYATIGGTTPTGTLTLSGAGGINLGGNITTAGGSVTLNGPTVLENSITIDTTFKNDGAAISFNGTLDDSTSLTHTLSLSAGNGDITFAGRVGTEYINGTDFVNDSGSPPAAVIITSANNVNLTMPLGPNGDGFSVGQFIIEGNGDVNGTTPGAASLTTTSFISTNTGGDAGAINIVTTGDVNIGQNIFAVGGNGTGNETMGNGGAVTINAGGAINIGSAIALTTQGSGSQTFATSPRSIAADGAQIVSPEQTPGDGGAITLTGASINLYQGASSTGGGADLTEATANGGKGGAISLTATNGNVTLGSAATGSLVGLQSSGGNAAGGNGGAGGDIVISATSLSFAFIESSGGQSSAGGTLGNGGNIKLIATATSGAAVTIFGNGDDPQATDLSSIGHPALLSLGATAGAITIESSDDGHGNASPLLGSSYIQLVDNSSYSNQYGGATVEIVAAGGAPGFGGKVYLGGPIQGANGTENLRLLVENGSAHVTGDVSNLNNIVLGCCGADINGNANTLPEGLTGGNGGVITFDGAVTANNIVDQRLYASPTLTTTAAIYLGAVNVANYNGATDMNDDSVAVEFKKGGTFTSSFDPGKGPVYVAGTFTFKSGFNPGTHNGCTGPCFKIDDDLNLIGSATFDASAVNDPINLIGSIIPSAAGESFTMLAGTGTITVGGTSQLGTTGIHELAGLVLQGGEIDLNNGGATTTTLQTYTGNLVLGANTTLKTDATGGVIELLGPVATGAHSVTVSSDAVVLAGNWSGTGARNLYPTTANTAVTLGGNAPVSLVSFLLNAAELAFLDGSSPSMVTIGSHANVSTGAQQTGAVTTHDFTFDAPLTIIGSSITADPINKDPGTGNLTLDAGGTGGVNGTNGITSVNLGKGDFLTINAGTSSLTGTVNGQSGNGAAQYVTANNGCAGCTFNGVADGSAGGGNPSPPPTAFTPPPVLPPPPQPVDIVLPPSPPDQPPPETPSDSDPTLTAYLNQGSQKPAANAEYHPQTVHPLGAYLNQMLIPSVPHNGVPGISFGYSLSGNSALW
ncbi:MAG TPA: filamentous hemagglutinin N-terminal domain-containing protein [Stellaceae bacterium]